MKIKKIFFIIFKLIILIVFVSFFSFLIIGFSPIDPVDAYIGADMILISSQQRDLISKKWGLDKPFFYRFINWSLQLLKGDFGFSIIYNKPVLNVIAEKFLASLFLLISAWLFSGTIGFFLGLFAGANKGSFFDKITGLYCYTLSSTPVFWFGIILIILFSVILQWMPLSGALPIGKTFENTTLFERIHHLILPVLTLSIISIANVVLHTREKTIELSKSDFVLFAKAQGEKKSGIIFHHLLRNSFLPAVTLQFSSFGEIFGGSVFVEHVFSYPGLGKAAIDAGIRQDIPLLMGIVLFTCFFVFFGNTTADLLYKKIDPRIDLEIVE